MTAGSVSRAVRAAIFVVVCVTTAALGHAWMSAQSLPWWALVGACGATASVAWWLTGRARGGFVITGATVLAQLGLHSAFDLAQPHPGGPVSVPTPRGGMPGMVGMPVVGDTGQLHPVHSLHGTPGMFLAHALAALVCGVWLWRGEAAAFRLARSAAAVLFAPLLLVLTTLDRTGLEPPARPMARTGHVVRLREVLLHHVLSRRGPPAAPVCC
ncbi:hypothetical protein [Streptomyces bugieae]|uniref:Integral membrane protein n=1 Tax=Streptomyces bugieae TaxID=3098223 RepID=A0ABU7NJF5_9ACTN|nr:hypothetical protein [Streptomyces sp. DSM 41528]